MMLHFQNFMLLYNLCMNYVEFFPVFVNHLTSNKSFVVADVDSAIKQQSRWALESDYKIKNKN